MTILELSKSMNNVIQNLSEFMYSRYNLNYYYSLLNNGSKDILEYLEPLFVCRDASWVFSELDIHVDARYENTLVIACSSIPSLIGLNHNVICEVAVIDFINVRAIRWFNPAYAEKYLAECHIKNIDPARITNSFRYLYINDFQDFIKQAKQIINDRLPIQG